MPKKLPKGWVQTTLGDVCDINPRRIGEPPPDDVEVSFVPMASVEEETGRIDASQVRKLGAVRKGYTQFRENDVIFAKITPCMENGKIALATGLKNGLAYGSTEFVVFRPFEGILPRYVLYFLLQPTFRRMAQRQMTGVVGQKRVPTTWLAKHSFRLAPTREQQRIVEKLDRLMSRIEAGEAALQRAQLRLKRYRDAVLEAAVTGELTRSWRAESGASESGERLLEHLLEDRRDRWEEAELKSLRAKGKASKNGVSKSRYREPVSADVSKLPALPNTWAWTSISQLAWMSGYGTSVKCSFEGEGPAVLRIPNIHNRNIELANLKYTVDKKNLRDSDFVAAGDFLIVRTNGSKELIGRGAVITKQLRERCGFASYLIRYRLVARQSTWRWLSIAWESRLLREQIESKALTTAGQYNISLSRLADTAVPLPPLAEQKGLVSAVERRLAAADRLEAKLARSQAHAKQQRQSLLLDAFAGKLVPQEKGDESASALLNSVREMEDKIRSGKRSVTVTLRSRQQHESDFSLLDIINKRFGTTPFTFDDLRGEINENDYEKTKAALFDLAQPLKSGNVSPLRMSFNTNSGAIEFALQAR